MTFEEWMKKYNIRIFNPNDEKGNIDLRTIVYQGTIGFSLARSTIIQKYENIHILFDELLATITDSQSLLAEMKTELFKIRIQHAR